MKQFIIVFLLLCISIGIVVYLLTKDTYFKKTSDVDQRTSAQTTVSFSPNPLLLTSDTGQENIIIDTGENQINFVQIKLSYNPKLITDIHFSPGTFFQHPQILNNFVDKEKGTATYILSLPTKSAGVKGKGSIANITFTTSPLLRSGDTMSLSFAPETMVTDNIHTTSVLKQANNLLIKKEKLTQN